MNGSFGRHAISRVLTNHTHGRTIEFSCSRPFITSGAADEFLGLPFVSDCYHFCYYQFLLWTHSTAYYIPTYILYTVIRKYIVYARGCKIHLERWFLAWTPSRYPLVDVAALTVWKSFPTQRIDEKC